MKIQQLLETDLFRYQYEWEEKRQQVIQMPARAGRDSSSALTTYSVHYALSKLGINAPKRWNSSYAATNVADNLYLADMEGPGLRRVVIPGDRPVGFVEGDFNEHEYNGFSAIDIATKIFNFLHDLKQQPGHEDLDPLLGRIINIMDVNASNDEGYQQFSQLVADLDQILPTLNQPTFAEQIVPAIKKYVDTGVLGATTYAHLPEGDFEVWFEGPYEAHKDNELDGDDQHDEDDESSPDPHDRDR